jgi:4-azaleucine resistance transporter AzlC
MRETALSADTRAELLAGVRAELPVAVGVIPFGMIFGVLGVAAGLPPALAQAMSAVIFAGSAQFIGVQLIGAGAPAAVLLLTTFIVNLRHLLYSASMAPHLRHLSPLWRWLLAYLLTDEAYVMTILHYNDRRIAPAHKHWFFLGAGLTLWLVWQASTAVGIFVGAQAPANWSLDFTLALTFIGLVVPSLVDRPNTAAALAAGVVAVLTHGLPYKLGLMAAALTGIIVGMALQSRLGRRQR